MKFLKYILIFLFIFSLTSYANDVCFTHEEIEELDKQLELDQNTIKMYQNRENKLRKEEPIIKYDYKKNGEVKQNITIPVENDNPLEYTVKFKINETGAEGWFPLYLWLGGFMVNTTIKDAKVQDYADCKFGVKLLSGAPTGMKFIEDLGFNIAIGLRSAGGTLSYKFPKPFSHTNLHLFYGIAYSTPIQKTFGIGVSLNF